MRETTSPMLYAHHKRRGSPPTRAEDAYPQAASSPTPTGAHERALSTCTKVFRIFLSALIALGSCLTVALGACLIGNTNSFLAHADDAFVSRFSATDMHNRNAVITNTQPTMVAGNITTNFGGETSIICDRTLDANESQGDFDEYVIDMSAGFASAQAANGMKVEASYPNIGTEPDTNRQIDAHLTFGNFVMGSKTMWEDYIAGLTNYCTNEMGLALGHDGFIPLYNADSPYRACIAPYACLRLASNFVGGYWMCGIESCRIQIEFVYHDTGTQVDLSEAFLTVNSLDYDGVTGLTGTEYMGQEAVGVTNANYRQAFLTPASKVGRWNALTSKWTGNTYAQTSTSGYFFNSEATSYSEARSDLAVTLYGVRSATNMFDYNMVDTGAWTHNMLYFGTIGTVEPPTPTKYVIGNDGNRYDATDTSHHYRLGDEVTFEVDQYVPGRDEVMGYYPFIRFDDTIQDDLLPVEVFATVEIDGCSYFIDGTPSINGQEVSFLIDGDLDVGKAGEYDGNLYGHTITFTVKCTVVDYPDEGDVYSGEREPGFSENSILKIYNSATVTFGATNKPDGFSQNTNEVAIELVPPALTIEKHASLSAQEAPALTDYQYLNHDEGNPNSIVRFTGTMSNTVEGTRAKSVCIQDLIPEGLTLVPGSVSAQGADGISVSSTDNTALITLDNLDGMVAVSFEYSCYTNTSGNGKEIVNTARTWAKNVPFDLNNDHNGFYQPGEQDRSAQDDGEIYLNDPAIEVTKTVSASPIQNDDYTRGEEYRVGDDFTYTVTMKNTAAGTYAHDVWLIDDQMPQTFEGVGEIVVTGLEYNNQGKAYQAPVDGTVSIPAYPYTGNTGKGWNSDTVHAETKTVESSYSLYRQDYADGNWGWALHLGYLPADKTITVTWTVRATQAANGWEVYNQAYATAANQPNDVFTSPEAIVWINTPEFDIDKRVTKSTAAYRVGDHAEFEVELNGLQTPGTLARQTTLQDILKTEGVEINESAAWRIYDQRANARQITDAVCLYACDEPLATIAYDEEVNRLCLIDAQGHVLRDGNGSVIWLADALCPSDLSLSDVADSSSVMYAWHQGERERYDDGSDQSWHIDLTQVYGDENGYWVADEDYRFVWRDGALARIDGERNPVGADGYSDHDGSGEYTVVWDKTAHQVTDYSYLRVEYETTINDHALENEVMVNDATANSIESIPVTDRAEITVIGAALDIEKSSTDDGSFEPGETATYELTIRNDASDTTAVDVQVQDAFTTALAGAVEITDDSLSVFDEQGKAIDGWTVTWKDNEAASHIGFTLDTNYDLVGGAKMTVRYEVRYLTDNGSSLVKNTAYTWASNAPQVSDDYETWPSSSLNPALTLDKGSDKQVYAFGETGTYTLHIVNGSDETVKNVVVKDELDSSALSVASVVKGSLRVTGTSGENIGASVTYLQAGGDRIYGFYLETGRDLAPGESLDVTYQVSFDAEPDGIGEGETVRIRNLAWTSGDNAAPTEDDNVVKIDPGEPDEPDEPDEPASPDEPDEPASPDEPDEPASPDEPDDPLDLENVETSPTLDKSVYPSTVVAGGTAHYTIKVFAGTGGLTSASVIDEMDPWLTIDESSIAMAVNGTPIASNYGFSSATGNTGLSPLGSESQGSDAGLESAGEGAELEGTGEDALDSYELEFLDAQDSTSESSESLFAPEVVSAPESAEEVGSAEASTATPTRITFFLGTLAANAEATIEYDCQIFEGATEGASLPNLATLQADGLDDLTAEAEIEVEAVPDELASNGKGASSSSASGLLGKTGDDAWLVGLALAALGTVATLALVSMLVVRARRSRERR